MRKFLIDNNTRCQKKKGRKVKAYYTAKQACRNG